MQSIEIGYTIFISDNGEDFENWVIPTTKTQHNTLVQSFSDENNCVGYTQYAPSLSIVPKWYTNREEAVKDAQDSL